MTIRQKQLLLAYLGYYTGQIDGIWGCQSKAATEAFQQAFMDTADGIFGAETEDCIRRVIGEGREAQSTQPDFWQEIRWFTRKEFACRCGTCGGFPAEPREELVKTADAVRSHFGKPIAVTSGVRCAAHNGAVGGVSNSRHLLGKAMDFRIEGKSASQVLAYVQRLPQIRYAYAIDNIHVHMDIA